MRSLAFAACFVVCLADVANGQKIEALEFSGSGRLLGFAPGTMVYVTEQGQRQTVKFAKPGEMSVTLKPARGAAQSVVAGPPTVDISGVLAPEQIRAGFTVVFNCTLDGKGKAVNAVESIKVLDVRPDGPGIHADGGPKDDGQPVLIKGIAKGFKKGTLTVSVPKHDLAPKGVIAIAVAGDVEVTFESHNPALAPRGAAVEVKGIQLGPNGDVAVNSISITLPTVAGKATKKRPGKAAGDGAAQDGASQGGGEKDGAAPPEDGAPDEAAPGGAKPDEPKDEPKEPAKPRKILPLGYGFGRLD